MKPTSRLYHSQRRRKLKPKPFRLNIRQALENTYKEANTFTIIYTASISATTTTNTNTEINFAVALKLQKKIMCFSKEELLACKAMFKNKRPQHTTTDTTKYHGKNRKKSQLFTGHST
ncbi:Hypothetical predicted protein [Octopus vulgaris]|uniref:Uncharacterized protein n=1 Tax=Octopus vulgaris TaxID=6645 RepID=A0AA36B024_OCTVU|nr:Hypothetical predicted protein [Octopus vulgaris]